MTAALLAQLDALQTRYIAALDGKDMQVTCARCDSGPTSTTWNCYTSSRASRPRTPTSNASTGPSALRYWIATSSSPCMKSGA